MKTGSNKTATIFQRENTVNKNKKQTCFQSFFLENRSARLFQNAWRRGTGDPSPTENLSKMQILKRTDIESAPTKYGFRDKYTKYK